MVAATTRLLAKLLGPKYGAKHPYEASNKVDGNQSFSLATHATHRVTAERKIETSYQIRGFFRGRCISSWGLVLVAGHGWSAKWREQRYGVVK